MRMVSGILSYMTHCGVKIFENPEKVYHGNRLHLVLVQGY